MGTRDRGRTHDHDEGQRDEHHTTDVRRRWRGKTLLQGGVGLMPAERKSKRKPKEKDCNRKVPLLQHSRLGIELEGGGYESLHDL